MNAKIKYLFFVPLFLLLLAVSFFIFHICISKKNARLSEQDKEAAFQQMKKYASQYWKDYVIHPEELFFEPDPNLSKIYFKKKPENSRSFLNERIQLLFNLDFKKGTSDTVQYSNGKLKIRTDEYASLFDTESVKSYFGIVIKVTVSGRGRISQSLYYDSIIKNLPEKSYVYPPRRISSFFPRDYYFYINAPRQPNVHIGLELRGSLDIKKITFYRCTPRKIPKHYIVTAEIMECSKIPEPEKSPYPDCMFTIKMKGIKLLKGSPIRPAFILIAPAFKDRKKMPGYYWKKGDRLYLHMLKWDEADSCITEVQQSDTLDDFDSDRFALQSYWEAHKEPVLHEHTAVMPYLNPDSFTKSVSGYKRPQNPPLTSLELKKRQERISAALNAVNAKLQNKNISPLQLKIEFERLFNANKKDFTYKDNIFIPKNTKLHYSFPGNYKIHDTKDLKKLVKDIKALSQYMQLHGVSFILALCPSADNIAVRSLFPEIVQTPDYSMLTFTKQLLENDVEVIYAFDEILKARNEYPLLFEYPYDGHPAHGTQIIMVKKLANYLHRHFPELIKKQYSKDMFTEKMCSYAKETKYEKNKPFWDIWFNHKRPQYPEVLLNGKFIYPSEQSPILLFGNSFLFTPAPWSRPYIVSLLVRELGMDISAFSRTAENPMTTCIFDLLNTPEKYLKNRKICVLYYGIDLLTNQCTVNIQEMDQLRNKK